MNLNITIPLIFLVFSLQMVSGQTVKGVLSDESDKTPISGATVKLLNASDSSTAFSSVSSRRGTFIFQGVNNGKYILNVTSIGYEVFQMPVLINDTLTDLKVVSVPKASKVLKTISIVGSGPPVKQKQDTVEYAASAFKVNPDANAEDLIKKMPGVTVDNGTVTAHGETVKKVTVDGREFFGDDATAALRNLPSEVIDKIQIFVKLSDQAAFTGFDDGSST